MIIDVPIKERNWEFPLDLESMALKYSEMVHSLIFGNGTYPWKFSFSDWSVARFRSFSFTWTVRKWLRHCKGRPNDLANMLGRHWLHYSCNICINMYIGLVTKIEVPRFCSRFANSHSQFLPEVHVIVGSLSRYWLVGHYWSRAIRL